MNILGYKPIFLTFSAWIWKVLCLLILAAVKKVALLLLINLVQMTNIGARWLDTQEETAALSCGEPTCVSMVASSKNQTIKARTRPAKKYVTIEDELKPTKEPERDKKNPCGHHGCCDKARKWFCDPFF